MNRKRLFSLINDLPTVFEVVAERKPTKEKPTVDTESKNKINTKVNYIAKSRLRLLACVMYSTNLFTE